MPFSKYFSVDEPPPAAGNSNDGQQAGLMFQLPAFMQQGVPTLAQGGGAEVLPFNSTWFANNTGGFYSSPPLLKAPSPLGLPVYSASGFDVLSVLARVASRPFPTIHLGPVDMTCSFVVVDIRRHDAPIVYCSPTFCRLTGYPEHEVLGRNCRFLQAPPASGHVRRGEPRRFTSQASVDTMRKAFLAGKECQTSIVNYRKDGAAFINLVSVIPIGGGERGAKGEESDVVYHVGFQVDLGVQPTMILEKLRDGSYVQPAQEPVATAATTTTCGTVKALLPAPSVPIQRKAILPPLIMSPLLFKALQNPALHRALPITTCTTAPTPLPSSSTTATATTTSSSSPSTSNPTSNSPLSLLILEYSPDPILVVSLKGAFLYVAPAITRLLGHRPQDLVGRAIADLAHPEDVVPLERQFKESSVLGAAPAPAHADGKEKEREGREREREREREGQAKIIDVLFRARTRAGRYVWVEARGRLHVEPGKGRKAIVLSARARGMGALRWGDVLPPPPPPPPPRSPRKRNVRMHTLLRKVKEETEQQSEQKKDAAAAAPVVEQETPGYAHVHAHGEEEEEEEEKEEETEFWAQLSGLGPSAGTIVSASPGIAAVLGLTPDAALARRVPGLCSARDRERVERVVGELDRDFASGRGSKEGKRRSRRRRVVLFVRMRREGEEEGEEDVRMVFYPTGVREEEREEGEGEEEVLGERSLGIAPPVVLLHVALCAPDSALAYGSEGEEEEETGMGQTELGAHARDPETNVFAELDVTRGSSWQYELQQLRFVNQRLAEEVKRLEAEVALAEGGAGAGAGVGPEEGPQAQAMQNHGVVDASRELERREFTPPAATVTTGTTTTTTTTATAYPAPASTGEGENPFAYAALTQQHENYAASLERYDAAGPCTGAGAGVGVGAAYDELEMALGIGAVESINAMNAMSGAVVEYPDMQQQQQQEYQAVYVQQQQQQREYAQHQYQHHQQQQQREYQGYQEQQQQEEYQRSSSTYYNSNSNANSSPSSSSSLVVGSYHSPTNSNSHTQQQQSQAQAQQMYASSPPSAAAAVSTQHQLGHAYQHQQATSYAPPLPLSLSLSSTSSSSSSSSGLIHALGHQGPGQGQMPVRQQQQQQQMMMMYAAPPAMLVERAPFPQYQQQPPHVQKQVHQSQHVQSHQGQGHVQGQGHGQGKLQQHYHHHQRRATIHGYDPRQEEVWGAMNPGVKRAWGGR